MILPLLIQTGMDTEHDRKTRVGPLLCTDRAFNLLHPTRPETFVNCRVMVPHSSQPCPAVAHTTHNQINVLPDVSGPPSIASQILIPLRLPQNRLPQKNFSLCALAHGAPWTQREKNRQV